MGGSEWDDSMPPAFGYDPSAFNISLESGQSTTLPVIIGNSGTGLLSFSATLSPPELILSPPAGNMVSLSKLHLYNNDSSLYTREIEKILISYEKESDINSLWYPSIELLYKNTKLIFEIPTRGILGYRNEFIVDTKGEGILSTQFLEFRPFDFLQQIIISNFLTFLFHQVIF